MLKIDLLPHTHPFASNAYLLTSGDEFAVIDPSAPVPETLDTNKVKYIILTHAHFDHMLDIDEWVEKTGAEVLVGADDTLALNDADLNCYRLFHRQNGGYSGNATPIKDGDKIYFGDETIVAISTPGHTPGSTSFLISDVLFSGDTIFAGGGYGKYTFPGGSFTELKKSIFKLLELDDNITVYPGHGEKTTIFEYKKDL